MMPVIRVSEQTWERLKRYARPLEDSADDVVTRALDALDITEQGQPGNRPQQIQQSKTPKAVRKGSKLPQKEFRHPLLETLLELGGASSVKAVRKRMEVKMKPRLSDADYAPVSSGEERWWNAVCWERKNLVEESLLKGDSERGFWELSELGYEFLKRRPAKLM